MFMNLNGLTCCGSRRDDLRCIGIHFVLFLGDITWLVIANIINQYTIIIMHVWFIIENLPRLILHKSSIQVLSLCLSLETLILLLSWGIQTYLGSPWT